jgi:hypothetical protein
MRNSKWVVLACIVLLASCQSHAQAQTRVDSIFVAIHTAAQMKSKTPPPTFKNADLYQLLLEDQFERIAGAASVGPTMDSNSKAFITRWAEHDSLRRARLREWTPELLSNGTTDELNAASTILAGRQIGGDTSDFWSAYLLASRAVSLGDTSANRIAGLSLSSYISKHGKRVNGDSIMQAWNPVSNNTSAKNNSESWLPSYLDALKEAQRTSRNIFIDFTGFTVTNARAMENNIFSRDDVKQLLQRFVLARLYTDGGLPMSESNAQMEESRFGTIALPFYAIISSDDKPLATFPGFTHDAEAFKRFLLLDKKYRWKGK